MRTDLEARIRAEIEKCREWKKRTDREGFEGRIAALEWVLTLLASEPATAPQSDDEIVDAMAKAAFEYRASGQPPLVKWHMATDHAKRFHMTNMNAALAVARPVIEREVRRKIEAEASTGDPTLDKMQRQVDMWIKAAGDDWRKAVEAKYAALKDKPND